MYYHLPEFNFTGPYYETRFVLSVIHGRIFEIIIQTVFSKNKIFIFPTHFFIFYLKFGRQWHFTRRRIHEWNRYFFFRKLFKCQQFVSTSSIYKIITRVHIFSLFKNIALTSVTYFTNFSSVLKHCMYFCTSLTLLSR